MILTFAKQRSIYDKHEQSNKQNAVEFIFYDQPNPEYLQYLAHDPLVLDVSAKETTKKLAYASEVFDMNNLSEIDYGIIKNVKKVIAQARFMTGSRMKEEDYRMGNMHLALDQVCSSASHATAYSKIILTVLHFRSIHHFILKTVSTNFYQRREMYPALKL